MLPQFELAVVAADGVVRGEDVLRAMREAEANPDRLRCTLQVNDFRYVTSIDISLHDLRRIRALEDEVAPRYEGADRKLALVVQHGQVEEIGMLYKTMARTGAHAVELFYTFADAIAWLGVDASAVVHVEDVVVPVRGF